jgi:hypothetical protein
MAQPDTLGVFERLILTAILTLRDDVYGITIRAKVQQLSHPKSVSLGKRCYRLEPRGERALEAAAVTAKRMFDSIIRIWGRDWASAGRETR